MRPHLLVVCLLWLGVGSGCATLFAPGPDRVPVASNPSGARVQLDSIDVGVTPTVVVMDRKNNLGMVRIEAPGYQPAAVQRAKVFNSIAILNCLGLLPWVVDLASGNHQKFDTTPINVNLVPGQPGAAPP